MVKPFLKWAGGKQKMTPTLVAMAQQVVGETNGLIECCVGGGAFSIAMREAGYDKPIKLCDTNKGLLNAWRYVLGVQEPLIYQLDYFNAIYNKVNTEEYYYELRSGYNLQQKERATSAARFIMLNKTCFNGLWRENKQGEMNVPWGKREFNLDAELDNTYAVHMLMRPVAQVEEVDLSTLTVEQAQRDWANKLVFVDPPYLPAPGTKAFNTYQSKPFNQECFVNLAHVVRQVPSCRFMLTHSVNNFVSEQFEGFNFTPIQAARTIACNGNRTPASEYVITNF